MFLLMMVLPGCAVAPHPYEQGAHPPVPRIAYINCILSNCTNGVKRVVEADVVYINCFLSRCEEIVEIP